MASKTVQRMAQTRERKRKDGLVPMEVWLAETDARFLREESDRTGYPVRILWWVSSSMDWHRSVAEN